jgi:transglutaminase-like putative cysteine protease
VRWVRDLYGNSVAVLTFNEPADLLHVASEVSVDLFDEQLVECHVEEEARSFPFTYPAMEQLGLMPFALPAYPKDAGEVAAWLRDLHQPGRLADTLGLLAALNGKIFHSLRYEAREAEGTQTPSETLRLGGGSCRDYAVLMMEAARHWGLAARFVTGYVLMGDGQHGATHAWTEIYMPGAGWQGYDPTNNKLAGSEHISTGVAQHPAQASPFSGSYEGPAGAFERLEVSVQVSAISPDNGPD